VAAKHLLKYVLIARHADGQAYKARGRGNSKEQRCFTVLGKSIDQLLLTLLFQNRRLCEDLSDDVLRALTDLLQRRVQWCAFTQAERLLEIFTVIFLHDGQPVRDLQERVLHATTSRATVKTTCFDPFLKVEQKPRGDGKAENESASYTQQRHSRLTYQVAVINFFSDMCIGHSVVCEAVLHKMLAFETVLGMLSSVDSELNLLISLDRRNSADQRVPRGVVDENEEDRGSTSDSDSHDEEVEELLDTQLVEGREDAWLNVGQSVTSKSEVPAHEREQNLMYQARGSLSRFIAESYFETLEVLQQELKLEMLQNDGLWGFIERSVQLIKRVPSNQKRWQTAEYTDCVGQTTFALALFYDYVVRIYKFFNSRLLDETSYFAFVCHSLTTLASMVRCCTHCSTPYGRWRTQTGRPCRRRCS
jgi:hypothetical protein